MFRRSRFILPAAALALLGSPVAANPFGETAAADDAVLAGAAGRADIAQISEADLRGTVAGNSISGPSTTGEIVIDGQAFQNLNGLAVINANTGNNVVMNSSMQVNVTIRPE